MTADGQGAEGAEVAAVLEREKAEGDDDEQDRFLVDVPAEEEGSVGAERQGADEVVPGGAEEKFDKRGLGGLLVCVVLRF